MTLASGRICAPPTHPPILHGGGLDAARRRFPLAPRPWIDLSTGVSPLAYPLPAIPASAWTRLPDDEATSALEGAAAVAYGVSREAAVVAGPGTQAFIQHLARSTPAQHVAIHGFTYAEHAARWRAASARVSVAEDLEELAAADVAIVVNPNNPDGRLTQPQQLAELAQRMARRGGLLIVDEAFMDFTPQLSLASRAGDGLVILRSFGKAYGLPGLRLGFALCGRTLADRLRRELGPWSVSGPALAVGASALADQAWLARSGALLEDAALRLGKMLRGAGFERVGGARLFLLVEREDAPRCFERLCRAGILTRRFPERPRWLRFGMPAAQDWDRLAQALHHV